MSLLYKRPNSPFYWVRFSHDGQRYRHSTKQTDLGEAQKYADQYLRSLRGFISPSWRGVVIGDSKKGQGWIRRTFHRIKLRKKGGLSKREIFRLLLESGGKCAVSGLPLKLYRDVAFDPFVASIDRIDNSRGYVPDNCRIVCLVVNASLNRWGLDAVMAMANALVANSLLAQSRLQAGKTPEALPTINPLIELEKDGG